jgi:GNAT superfamily N-acetyltransferase
MSVTIKSPRIEYREIGPDDWPAIAQLFGKRGACGGCWCMHWRREKGGKAWEAVKGEPNRRAFQKLVTVGAAHGIIAFDGPRPVGWCSFGRREEFPRLERTKSFQPTEKHPGLIKYGERYAERVWSINCLFLIPEYRRRKLSQGLVKAAVQAIRRERGGLIEAYPVTLTKDGKQLPAAFSYTGPEVLFQRLGFVEVQRLAATRPLYCLELR